MAQTNDDGGYGGTSPGGGICWISPSDLAGQVYNLMSRLAQAEADIERLKSANVSAQQLSDIAEAIGLLVGGTIVMPGDPTNTMSEWAGTVMPTGFSGSVVSGNVTTTWTNGVVSFQVNNQGVVTGGDLKKYAILVYSVGYTTILDGTNEFLPMVVSSQEGDFLDATDPANIFFTQNGVYSQTTLVHCVPVAGNFGNGDIDVASGSSGLSLPTTSSINDMDIPYVDLYSKSSGSAVFVRVSNNTGVDIKARVSRLGLVKIKGT